MKILLRIARYVYRFMVETVNKIYRSIADPLELSPVIVVGQACNLKCINCSNFCPISLPETKSYPVENIIESLEILFQNCHKIIHLQIQGGEPFIYRDLIKLMDYLRTQKKILRIDIATNGMLIPSKEVLNTIKKDNRVSVRISDYKMSHKPIELKRILDVMGIPNYYYEFMGNKGVWRDLGGAYDPPVDDKEKEEHFKTCAFNTCLTLENGELTYCSRATNAYKIQKFERQPEDFLAVNHSRDFKHKLKEFVRKPHPMEACRYCNGTVKGKAIKPAIQPSTMYCKKENG